MMTTNSIHVIASQRVGAKRRPMTGSAKQSIAEHAEEWIASSQALLAMTEISASFRGDAQHRTRNLEIPRCALRI